ncbi:carbohydrate binding domain-containing protein [Litorimonas sp. WD9-15]|uniref:carbohydrate binding domain-containing protein n=1 Tax=Litorimonas sp. WD9-15 TaxID=3418716 RepID=UPI003D01B245
MFKRAFITTSCAAFVAIATTPSAMAQDDAAIQEALVALDAQLPGKLINNPYDIQWRTDGSDKKDAVVKSEGAPGGMAYQVRVKKAKRNAWDTATRIPMTENVEKGDVILMSFWARTEKPPKGSETGDILVAIQRNVEPYDSILEKRFDLGTEWKLHHISGTASRDYSAEKSQIVFNLAKAKQTLEFGQFYVMNLGEGADASPYMK